MKTLYYAAIGVIAFFAFCGVASANNYMREWNLASGEQYRAELLSYDEEQKLITIRLENQSEVKLQHDDLSAFDRAWLLEWLEFGEEQMAMLKKLGGKLSQYTSTGKYPTEYSVYEPPMEPAAAVNKRPLLILFHPSGNGHREILRYAEAAIAVGMNVVSCEFFRNGPPITAYERVPDLEEELLARFNELLPHIEATVSHDPNRMFMGGCSGGAWRSFHYSAQVKRPWAGVYSNCGWMGGEIWYDLPYPAMRVAMVNGDKDPAAKSPHVERDTERLQQAGCKVSLHAFEGGHQVPPVSVQTKAFRWLLSDE